MESGFTFNRLNHKLGDIPAIAPATTSARTPFAAGWFWFIAIIFRLVVRRRRYSLRYRVIFSQSNRHSIVPNLLPREPFKATPPVKVGAECSRIGSKSLKRINVAICWMEGS
jgi:hypothetical protein